MKLATLEVLLLQGRRVARTAWNTAGHAMRECTVRAAHTTPYGMRLEVVRPGGAVQAFVPTKADLEASDWRVIER